MTSPPVFFLEINYNPVTPPTDERWISLYLFPSLHCHRSALENLLASTSTARGLYVPYDAEKQNPLTSARCLLLCDT